MSRSRRLPILEVFRGIAALFVVLHHSLISIEYYHNYSNPFLQFICHIGKYGVDFFFVLSGFIITYSYTQNRIANSNDFKHFLKLRFLRIYTPFLPISFTLLILYFVFPTFSNSNKEIDIITSLTLIPVGKPALSVAWTLSHEMLFYIIFSLQFVLPKIWNKIILIWGVSILVFYVFPFKNSSLLQLIISPYNIEFIIGVLIAYLYCSGFQFSQKIVAVLTLFFCVLFIGIIWKGYYEIVFLSNIVFALFTGAFIGLSLNSSLNPAKPFLFLGTISYSIYLIHNPLQMLIVRYFSKIQSEVSFVIVLFLILFFVLLSSWVYYYFFENKLTTYLKRLWM